MSCQHGNWPPCELCDELEAAYELGRKSVLVADGGERVKELVDQMQCTQSMIEHIERCEQWFREGAGTASYEELMTWCDNLMSCVTPRKAYNEAALAKFQPAGGENDG